MKKIDLGVSEWLWDYFVYKRPFYIPHCLLLKFVSDKYLGVLVDTHDSTCSET